LNNKIENFSFFNSTGVELKVDFGYQIDDIFKNNSEENVQNFYDGSAKGVKWTYNGKEVVINRCFFAYPSADENYIIAIYPLEDKGFPSPNNAVVYNLDGSLHKVLTPPRLVSQLAIDRLGIDNPPKPYAPDSIFFNNVKWDKDNNGKIVTSVWIGYDREWHENRVLIPATGEFGECLGSGRL
jgi:hypothetical protein